MAVWMDQFDGLDVGKEFEQESGGAIGRRLSPMVRQSCSGLNKTLAHGALDEIPDDEAPCPPATRVLTRPRREFDLDRQRAAMRGDAARSVAQMSNLRH